jgi:hypothetical protein
MNIFVLSENPIEAAQMQCNKHISKMVVESAQMLSTAHRMLDGKQEKGPSKSGKTMSKKWLHSNTEMESILYKAVHMSHPCTIWTTQSDSNYKWHYDHFVALCDEYTYRYEKIHATDKLLRNMLSILPQNIKKGPMTPFALAMKANPECIYENDPVRSYRAFYQTKQDRFNMVWSKREVPEWFKYK